MWGLSGKCNRAKAAARASLSGPPETKLLAEFNGKVIDQRQINNVKGNMIKISDFFHTKLHKLEGFLEEKNHLVDKII